MGTFTHPVFAAMDFAPEGPVGNAYHFYNPAVTSACGVTSVPNVGNISAINDRDGDGDLQGVLINWDVFDGRFIRAPFVNTFDNQGNPWGS